MAKDDLDPPHMQPELPGLYPRGKWLQFDTPQPQAAGATVNLGGLSPSHEALIGLMREQLRNIAIPNYQVARSADWQVLARHAREAMECVPSQWRRVIVPPPTIPTPSPPPLPNLTAHEIADLQRRRNVELQRLIDAADHLSDPPAVASPDELRELALERDRQAALQARQATDALVHSTTGTLADTGADETCETPAALVSNTLKRATLRTQPS